MTLTEINKALDNIAHELRRGETSGTRSAIYWLGVLHAKVHSAIEAEKASEAPAE